MKKILSFCNLSESKRFWELILLFLLIIASGVFSLYLGNGTDEFDVYNYHIYSPWAFLHNRFMTDILPCGIRSYFNPILDILGYLLFHFFNDTPKIFIFLQGCIYGILIFCSYKLSTLFQIENSFEKICFRITCTVLTAISPFLLPLTGTLYTDFYVAILILTALYIYLKNLYKTKESGIKYNCLFISGILLGAVSGLKLTSNLMIFAMFICSLCTIKYIENPKKVFITILAGFIPGFCILNLYWYYKIWNIFHNPFFPYFNDIFHSEYGQGTAVFFDSYALEVPAGFINKLLFPFTTYAEDKHGWFGCSNFPFNDILIPIAAIIIPLFLVCLLFKIKNNSYKNYNTLLFLTIFVIISYVLWLNLFCILRFIIPVLIISVTLIVYALHYLINIIAKKEDKYPKIKIFFAYILLVAISITFSKTYLGNYHKPIEEHIINKPIMTQKIEDNSVVLLASQTVSYIIPFLNQKAEYISLIFPLESDVETGTFAYDKTRTVDYYYSKYYEDKIKEKINSNKKIYLITLQDIGKREWALYKNTLKYYKNGNIRFVQIGENNETKIYRLDWT